MKDAMQSYYLSIFSFIVIYYMDNSFAEGLLEILMCYRKAYLLNAKQVKDIVIATVDLMGQKENLMWTVRCIRNWCEA